MTMNRTIIPLLGGAGLLMATGIAPADSNWGSPSHSIDVMPVKNHLYQNECGICHFAYPPGLLPAQSWKNMMTSMNDHFGENAELDGETNSDLVDYLVSHSADNVHSRRSARIVSSLGNAPPLRITEVPYIQRKHNEIPGKLIHGNAQVRSLSNCTACHTRADKGFFSHKEVVVPGAGRWEWGFE